MAGEVTAENFGTGHKHVNGVRPPDKGGIAIAAGDSGYRRHRGLDREVPSIPESPTAQPTEHGLAAADYGHPHYLGQEIGTERRDVRSGDVEGYLALGRIVQRVRLKLKVTTGYTVK